MANGFNNGNNAAKAPKKKGRWLKTTGKVAVTVFLVLSILLLSVAIYAAVANRRDPDKGFVFKYKPMVIASESMHPVLKLNCIVFMREIEDYSKLREDDIIVFKNDDTVICHRIIAVSDRGIFTKGDNNNVPDGYPLSPDDIKGIVSVNNLSVWNWIAPVVGDVSGVDGSANVGGIIKWAVLVLLLLAALFFSFSFIKVLFIDGEPDPDNPNSKRKTADKTARSANLMANVIMITALAVLAAAGILTVYFRSNPDRANIMGYRPVVVDERVMAQPEIMKNTLVIIKAVPAETIRQDDIITYNFEKNGESTRRTEKVIKVTPAGLETQSNTVVVGGNHYRVDPETVIGKVVMVMNWTQELTTTRGILKFVVIPLFIVVLIVVLLRMRAAILKRRQEERELAESGDIDREMEEPEPNERVFVEDMTAPPAMDRSIAEQPAQPEQYAVPPDELPVAPPPDILPVQNLPNQDVYGESAVPPVPFVPQPEEAPVTAAPPEQPPLAPPAAPDNLDAMLAELDLDGIKTDEIDADKVDLSNMDFNNFNFDEFEL